MNDHEHKHHEHGPAPEEAVTDPVCGMAVKPDSPHRTLCEGREVLFCSGGCKEMFEANPARYTRANDNVVSIEPVQVPAGVKWTCPMHSQIIRDGPGSCPICGMA